MCSAVPAASAWPDAEDQNLGSMFRWFSDSDQVAVRAFLGDYTVALRNDFGLDLHWNHERVLIPAIDEPVGSPEAVDAITTASRPISGNAYSDFLKVRNEFQGALSRGGAALDYYYSHEVDYLAQQVGVRYSRPLMEARLTVAAGTSYGWDEIAPVADDDTQTPSDTKTTLHWNAVATQVVTPTTMVRLGVEFNAVNGLQHNPYRNVYAGGTYVPERHPDQRDRRDAFVRLHQYLPNRSSLKLHYRLYDDTWGIGSHEADAKLSQYLTHGVFARYEYRWYTQGAADFYRDEYTDVQGVGGYRTSDYRMGELSSHLFGFALDFDLDRWAADHPALGRLGTWVSYQRYFNSNNYSANILEAGVGFRF
jgi:hypothetical protein